MSNDRYDVYEVFTPTKPARLTYVEREGINTKLVNALRTPGKQVVVYGHSGSGKTTLLLNKLQQLYEQPPVISRCMTGLAFEQLVLDAFDQLAPFYVSEASEARSTQISTQLSGEYLAIKAQIGGQSTHGTGIKSVRILPPQLTPQALARFMGEARACWVLEDFHKIDESERKKLSQIMKVFMDSSDVYGALKIIALGATDTARQVVEYDPEMKNRVAEIYVPLMDEGEIKAIISKGCQLLHLRISESLMTDISKLANGLASVCHHLCLNLCTTQNIYQTLESEIILDEEMLNQALQVYLDEVSDTIKMTFDTAFKQTKVKMFDNAKLIIKALCSFEQEGAIRAEIYKKIVKSQPKYPQGNLTLFLNKLTNESELPLLRFDATSGRYSFRDPVYRAFALVLFRPPKQPAVNIAGQGSLLGFLASDTFQRFSRDLIVQLQSKNQTEK